MAETAMTNGSIPTVEIVTKEQARALHAELNRFYRKDKKKKLAPVLKPVGKTIIHQRNITVQEIPTDLDDITDELFSLDTNATQLYVKLGKQRIRCINSGKNITVGAAQVHKVFL